MVEFESKYSAEELIQRWDEHTSISRFAGCDDTMDLIFVSKRKGNSVKLVRKARYSREPFSPVFRGKIENKDSGSKVVGFFTKTWADYSFVLIINAILFYVRTFVIDRGESPDTINTLIAASLLCSILLLLNYRPSKRRYAEFISRITGEDNELFVKKSDRNEED